MSDTSVKLEGEGKAGNLLLLLIEKLAEYIFVQCLFYSVHWLLKTSDEISLANRWRVDSRRCLA